MTAVLKMILDNVGLTGNEDTEAHPSHEATDHCWGNKKPRKKQQE